ncbi:MAG: hypothetical protein Q8909_15235, partial [Bacteroidota bacterium]|nr:hypothetical protein [Bacteroidota bacterium]
KLDKTDYRAFNSLGMIELRNNLLPGALDHLSMAISLKPNYFSARINRAHAERLMGNPGAAVMDYDFVLEHNPHWTAIYAYRGEAKLEQRDYRGAYRDFCRANAQDPGLEEAGLKKQLLEAEHGDLLTADAAGHPTAPRRGFGLMFNFLGRLKLAIASFLGHAVLLLLLRVGDLVPDLDDLIGLVQA